MINSQILIFFKNFSSNEMRQFGKFVRSKSNANKLLQFCDYLEKQHPDFPTKKMEKTLIVQKLFSSENTRIIDNLITRLTSFIDDFIAQKELEHSLIEKDLLRLKWLKRNKLDDLFLKEVERIEKKWKKEEGIERLHDLYRLQKMRLDHPNFSGKEALLETKKLSQKIDVYYFATKLYLEVSMMNTAYSVKEITTDFDHLLYPVHKLVAFLKDKEISSIPQIKLLSQIFEAIYHENFKNRNTLKDEFTNSIQIYTKGEQNDIVSFLRRIFYEDYKDGTKGSLQVLHELNRFSVDEEIVLEDGYIAADLFQTIVNIACAYKQFEWAESFIENNHKFLKKLDESDTLKKSDQLGTYLLCQVTLHLSKKEYDKVIEKLTNLNFDTKYNGAIARSFKLQAYFHLNNYDGISRLIHSFKEFLRNKRTLSIELEKSFRNFIGFIEKIYEFKYLNSHKIDGATLKKEINNCSQVVCKGWLLEQL